jgi:hypothetical protein
MLHVFFINLIKLRKNDSYLETKRVEIKSKVICREGSCHCLYTHL